jgi:hypothetical protein
MGDVLYTNTVHVAPDMSGINLKLLLLVASDTMFYLQVLPAARQSYGDSTLEV